MSLDNIELPQITNIGVNQLRLLSYFFVGKSERGVIAFAEQRLG